MHSSPPGPFVHNPVFKQLFPPNWGCLFIYYNYARSTSYPWHYGILLGTARYRMFGPRLKKRPPNGSIIIKLAWGLFEAFIHTNELNFPISLGLFCVSARREGSPGYGIGRRKDGPTAGVATPSFVPFRISRFSSDKMSFLRFEFQARLFFVLMQYTFSLIIENEVY